MFAWWNAHIVQPYGAKTNITLGNGATDIEKGDVFSIPAYTPIDLPIPGKVVWEDAQHMVVQTSQGVLNFLHISPQVAVGTMVQPGQQIGSVSSLVGTVNLPNGHTYTESGNVLEVGLYGNQQTAINRENYVNGRDVPSDFSNIYDPNRLFATFGASAAKAQPQPASNITFNVGPWPVSIPNPLNAVGGFVVGVEGWMQRIGLAMLLAIGGFVLIVLAARKPIVSTLATAK